MKNLLIFFGALVSFSLQAQTYDTNNVVVQTFAGSGFSGYVDGVGQQTMFNNPNAIVADSHGNLFVWDHANRRIRRIAPDGTVTTFAGGGNQTTGVGTNVNLDITNYGVAMTVDRNDTIWLVPFEFAALYKVTSGAVITSSGLPGVTYSYGICADSLGNLYISSSYVHKIFRYTTNGILSVFAGSGNNGYADGSGIFTAFSIPKALAIDPADNIYVWDSGNHLVRRIDQNNNVTTYAGKYGNSSVEPNLDGVGTNAVLNAISQMCFDNSGNLLLACGLSIRKISPSTNVVTLAGSFSQSDYANGAGNLARFAGSSYGLGVCFSGGMIYVADSSNQRIRSITNNPSAEPVQPANLQLNTYTGLQITGTVGRTYQVQASPDMTNWTTRATLLLNSSPYLWIDQNPVSANKFYRALLLP
ncbi:MAG: hypothetical protein ABIR24_11960 [Verrucomicrobiota bacterium]